ncbi:exodeoxyribonuclease V alpha subunit [Lachnospiraceae bacterium XBD2001]|nr:exodeoxyribonuclease V alpha subunit [Lachnospiraceae bacterium XBD2001]
MEKLNGYIEHIIYKNEENAYTVLVVVPEGLLPEEVEEQMDDASAITCVGIFPGITEGVNVEMEGEYTNHVNYGMQFKMSRFHTVAPKGEEEMKRYLGSGAIKGIGPALAIRIVKKFKADTFRVMEEEPERLAEVKGISERMAMDIADQMVEKRDLREAMMFLAQYGINNNLSVKIYQEYGPDLYKVVEENPYKMAEDIRGIGFKIADEIAAKIGIRTDSEFRVRSGLLYVLLQATQNGHTYLPKDELLDEGMELLRVDRDYLEANLMNMAIDKKVVIKGEAVYAYSFYHMESATAQLLVQLDDDYQAPDIMVDAAITAIEKEEDMELEERQRKAVHGAVQHGVFILTGGPGTGKTTTIRAIIKYFEREGKDIFLAAPTGRAAKRMSEATGYEARTIHRMLEVNGKVGEESEDASEEVSFFQRNEQNPLETDVIIIDEVSMVDITLMYALLRAVASGTRLILVGDVNQLPSVGPGNVLRDIILSERFSVVRLEKIFRQATQSDIVMNAHKIQRGEPVTLDNKSKDFFFMQRPDADHIISVVIKLVQENMPKYVHATPNDIQVLTPTRKGLLGVERLNKILQQYLNPPADGKKEREFGERIFREGDKVMQIKNNYQIEWEIQGKYRIPVDKGTGVFNGDMGIVREINDYTSSMWIEYDEGKMVEYPYKQVDELEHAYAITIHKSQGSEYPAVVIPLLPGPQMLMNRNLIYTAITRAKQCCVLVGDPTVFENMIRNTNQARRYSGLCERLNPTVE